MAESEEELKNLLVKVKEESKKTGLKFDVQKMKIMASRSWHLSWQIDGLKVETLIDFILEAPKSLWMVTAAKKLKAVFAPWKKSCDKPGQTIKKQRHHFSDKGLSSQSYGFSNSHVQM